MAYSRHSLGSGQVEYRADRPILHFGNVEMWEPPVEPVTDLTIPEPDAKLAEQRKTVSP